MNYSELLAEAYVKEKHFVFLDESKREFANIKYKRKVIKDDKVEVTIHMDDGKRVRVTFQDM